MDSSKDHFYNLLLSLNKDLFNLTLNDKLIINDKDEVATEVLSMLTTEKNVNKFTIFDVEINDDVVKNDLYVDYNFNVKPISTKDKQVKSSLMFNIKLTYLLNLIFSLVDQNNEYFMSVKKNRQLIEVGIRARYKLVTDYLQSKDDKNQIIWDQPIFDETRKEIKDEIFRARYKPKGVKIAGKQCGRCKSEELYFSMQQTRSGDEPMTTFFRCLACGNEWQIR